MKVHDLGYVFKSRRQQVNYMKRFASSVAPQPALNGRTKSKGSSNEDIGL